MTILQKCENCHAQFSWSKIYKSILANYRPIKCNECCTKHEITFLSRTIVAILTILPLFTLLIFLSPTNDATLIFGIATVGIILVSLIVPFLVSYKNCL
ncbi:TIGR04104 family putative zinc finger protein [Alkalibacillus almallahensis]|uniref:TIGR04104 family putative zinc finger protein n=1 Tax=Alkalibacillus almallahensis TaxID=1379154 RepID=UPI003C7E9B70